MSLTAVSLHGPCHVFLCKLLGPYPKTTFATVVFKWSKLFHGQNGLGVFTDLLQLFILFILFV